MSIEVFVNSLTFSDNSTIPFKEDEIVLFVGPNNAGKSASLKEIFSFMQAKVTSGKKVVKDIQYSTEGNIENLTEFLESNSKKYTDTSSHTYYQGLGFSIHVPNVNNMWQYANHRGLGELAKVFVNLLSTENRLTAASPPQNISLTTQPPSHPIHFLQRDDLIEFQFSNYFRQAFGQDLIVHRNAGNLVPLYVGDKPILQEGEDRVSISYLQRLEKLPMLHEQGDGMRGFVGVLLNAFISNHSVLLIDEPEAFLHPPQARLLGKMLGKDLPTKRQLFLSTHSEHFLKGLLDSNNQNLKIIRIQREQDVNKVSVLNSQDINAIWNDSLLRHSNVLDGLFHTRVIICESDSDSRFYSAILDSLYDDTNEISPDILFIHCGGKHRIPTVVRALRKLNVPVSVIADFDVLNDTNPLRSIYAELGGEWSAIEADWRLIKNSIDVQRPELETEDVKVEISNLFSQVQERILPKHIVGSIQKILKKTSAWSKAKEVGKNFIPNGSETQAYNRLSEKLELLNFYIVEVGELECFVKSIGNHGPAWVNEVLSRDLKNDPDLEIARSFIRKIVSP